MTKMQSEQNHKRINLYYIGGDEDFNRKSAGIARIINNCKALRHNLVFNIKIIGYSDVQRLKKENFEIFNTKRGNNRLQKYYYYLIRALSIIRLLKEFTDKPDIIIYYGTSSRIIYPLILFCKYSQIKLIVDVVEWYNYSHLPLGQYGPSALDIHLAMTKFIPKCDGIIAISSLLQKYYNKNGNKTIRVPILIDDEIQTSLLNKEISFESDYLNLIYAGLPGKKDLIMNVIKAVEYCSSIGLAIRLHLLGPTKSELESFYKYQISNSTIFHGRISQSLVPEYLRKADFSVLLRPDERYAHAGFPTKFVESINVGLPVIANITSDLSKYLVDGYNGFIVPSSTVESLVTVLKVILSMDRNEFKQMKINAKNTAKDHFQYQLYSQSLSKFVYDVYNN